ncbi:hypothetical protein AGABI1DRAFT_106639 [Agaricus bisporus var. burnettii JB137-S8]|uniref:C2H2-type domain-containing protein n=1 Tax=Agaricus bisporus var. burnettii (strain JB137-S8 / ATCC MYA-4627 / FGSC 10392) TaxID=597362 RepID=K5WY75_AGABU|nr:uncharacterized protein AGABI1DRAFT_106639 [Agaricus bisporus var. burnettii JB137-S8]EKM80466.1 hypothetical protein AGABI1DRAFT_106639 [Agaricus bisporus var. burnettii JB137-S8]
MLTSPAGNMTLASLNTYSPPGLARSSLWSFGAASPADAMDICDDFQSNVPLKISHGLSHSGGPTGLGIIYPSSIQKEQLERSTHSYNSGSGHNMIYNQPTFMPTEAICYDSHFGPGPSLPGEVLTETLLYPTELTPQIYDLMNEGPVVEIAGDSSVLTPVSPQPSNSIPHDIQGAWILQKILEISGHTIESLSSELRASPQDHQYNSMISNDMNPEFQSNAAYPQNALFRLRDSPVFGINPADILPPRSDLEPPQLPPPEASCSVQLDSRDIETETSNTIPDSVPVVPLEPASDPVPLTTENLRFLEMPTPLKRESDYEPSLPASVSSSNQSTFLPSLPKRKLRPRGKRATKQVVKHVFASVSSPPVMEESMFSNVPINYGTPVLDAHRGIELKELKAKAERYRLRNQRRDYDKKWLLSFAGKLTPQGLLTEEYRCYINGCNQFNRRRDHILIHVGGHLDQRPFACSHCSARFLRKNECKRHELSHTGTRPFTCDLCPSGVSAFVRQDLLKRHQKRTHSLDNTRSRILKRQSRT